RASSLCLLSSFKSSSGNTSPILHIGCISLEFVDGYLNKNPLRIHRFQRLLFSEADRRDWSLWLRQHQLEHLAEISKKAIDHAGAEQMRLVDTASHEAATGFAQHQNNIEFCDRH